MRFESEGVRGSDSGLDKFNQSYSVK